MEAQAAPSVEEVTRVKRYWGHLKVWHSYPYKNTPIVIRKESDVDASVYSFNGDTDILDSLLALLKSAGVVTTCYKGSLVGHGYGTWD